MSSTSSGRRVPSTSAAVASSPAQKRARDEASSGSPSDPDAAPAKNPRRAFASSPFADFGSYMAAKNSKLAAQFEADAATSGAGTGGLFAGVSIFVDGFTVPSSQDPLSSDEQKASTFEEIDSGDFTVDEGEYDCESACSETRGDDMDDPNFVENYFKFLVILTSFMIIFGVLVLSTALHWDMEESVADQFYGILHKHCSKVQALSCDEAFLDMTECLRDDPEEVTRRIRTTRSAKPNGQRFIPYEKADDYLSSLSIKALPGIGPTVSAKLKSKEIEYCGQLRNISKDALHKDFGKKISDLLWNYCRGIDHSIVGSVQAEHFLTNLCKEVSLRLQGCGVQGRTITLKVKTRREGAGEPIKYMGCGDCETTSRSLTIAGATDSFVTLQRIAKQLFSALRLDVKQVRGVGLAMSKLEHADLARGEMNLRSDRSTGVHNVELPPLSQLDLEVLKNLPPEIMSEMNAMYKGELQGLLDTLNRYRDKKDSMHLEEDTKADFTVLQELPEDVKADLFSTLPLHRSGDPTCSTSNVSERIKQSRVSSCLILNVETDIEELYKCFCLLKRFASASEFFLELHDSILPFLQLGALSSVDHLKRLWPSLYLVIWIPSASIMVGHYISSSVLKFKSFCWREEEAMPSK
ncbi:DNA repair protein REV1 [Dichanthelium oligosanthes]|uniref:DNA repair protein REV1 n=1 Tax=Dichanthelium oligosanthes TaxID=888268 RepID=A0A1E5W645_9POAL|nr:DNA repair protein REV1 [Dichanthelium oligosanthes]